MSCGRVETVSSGLQLSWYEGGEPAIRDPGLLESALHRPQTGYYADLAEMAAALFESLVINHPVVDGNKRLAFFATAVFLRLNRWKLEFEDEATHSLLTELLDSGHCDFDHLLRWIRRSLTTRQNPAPQEVRGAGFFV